MKIEPDKHDEDCYCPKCCPEYDHDDDGEYTDFDDEEEDEFERAMDECGMTHEGICMLAGTEYCDWECPFREEMYRNLNRKRDAKGRFTK